MFEKLAERCKPHNFFLGSLDTLWRASENTLVPNHSNLFAELEKNLVGAPKERFVQLTAIFHSSRAIGEEDHAES